MFNASYKCRKRFVAYAGDFETENDFGFSEGNLHNDYANKHNRYAYTHNIARKI